ncbi:MAG: LPS export ABC transporter permease LptG [Gammaproteobacteria bacterium]|nr:LPS export ABC transporter permease LptG [Gammaproteobacteria bacterium]MYD76468.1 LPS export ABC transporter permease LptG [Gammaproteobacteria bacterium]MYJ52852.1 LPS export ABC transporter permease LptG [Gammaproteobacteria bacterium]
MMSTLDRYLGRIILQYTLITTLVLLCLYTFVNFLDQMVSIGQGGFHLKEAVVYVVLLIPGTLYELFPMATLLGAITGLSVLAGSSELTAMRSSGASMLQITGAALKVGGVFVVLCLLVGEFVAPHTQSIAQRGRAEALQEDIRQHTRAGLWMRDANTYTTIREILPDLTLTDIKSFEFDNDGFLQIITEAKRGRFVGDSWILAEARITTLDDNVERSVERLGRATWNTAVTPDILSTFLIKPDQLSFGQLRRYIDHLRENRQNSNRFALALWNKIMLPLAIAAMVALAVPFVFTNLRSGNLGRNLFLGIMLGIAFYVANRGFGYAVLANGIPPVLGASIPVLALLLLVIALMRRI